MSELPDDFELAAWMPLPPLDPQHVADDLDGLTVQLAGFVERGPGDLDLLVLVLDDGRSAPLDIGSWQHFGGE